MSRLDVKGLVIAVVILMASGCSNPSVSPGRVALPSSVSIDESTSGSSELGPIVCDGLCPDGFNIGGTGYELTCGALELGQHPVSDDVVASGSVMWSDDPIEVREIVSGDPNIYLAVLIDGDICEDEPGAGWYVASAGSVSDWGSFCDLLGTTVGVTTGRCVE